MDASDPVHDDEVRLLRANRRIALSGNNLKKEKSLIRVLLVTLVISKVSEIYQLLVLLMMPFSVRGAEASCRLHEGRATHRHVHRRIHCWFAFRKFRKIICFPK